MSLVKLETKISTAHSGETVLVFGRRDSVPATFAREQWNDIAEGLCILWREKREALLMVKNQGYKKEDFGLPKLEAMIAGIEQYYAVDLPGWYEPFAARFQGGY